MALLRFLLHISRRTVILAILLGVVSGASSTMLLALLNSKLSGGAPAPGLLWWFIGFCVLVPVARFSSEIILLHLGMGALYKLRVRMCRQILAVPMRQLEKIGAPRLLAALTEDIPSITNALTFVPICCIHSAVVVGCLIYLGWLSPYALLGVLGFMVVGVTSYHLPATHGARLLSASREKGDELYSHFQALMYGTKELKLNSKRRAAFLEKVLEPTADSVREHNFKGLFFYTAASSWGQILFFVVIGALVFALPRVADINNEVLTGCALVLLYLMIPLEVILNTMPNLSRANIALRKVQTLGLSLDSYAEPGRDAAHDADAPPDWRKLELAGVTHVYHREQENSNFVLGPVDLTFYPGEVVFLTGGNGSGKTTLMKLVIGLYEPEDGEILFDGRPVTAENREAFRQNFSVVFSDFFLFEALLGEDAHGLDERAFKYLCQLQLNHKVEVKDGALSTTALSQGQRKRLALLAAYLEDRPIYVFDEWAADQDPHFKEVFYMQLLPELKARGKALLVISHDDRYYHLADRLIKIDYGQIVYDDVMPGALLDAAQIPVS
jgi:putative pyoverdin transport system ATP-binding/permease protein